ncbi:MAG: hypothetical protein EOQ81_22910 [Mesorhizobium sp.]|uniref:hypothetical protein n=1 Tax=Mesorhizobium sp. TaxID=1871066 RepID=UPI000FE7EEC8|nr:hypothetical protein [Mesorhizobium sp.]RWH52573.1 MAG: hypothetical protein EOQ81_22910 [Mesorhizobium sp.]
MSDQDDEFDDDEAVRAEIIRRARVEGIKVAYESALEICRDKTQTAVARASSQRTLLQIGGMLDRADRNASAAKDPAEMDGDELRQALERASRKRKLAVAAAKPSGGAFD